MVRIFTDDTVDVTAKKIFNEFDVFQSCSINGFVRDEAKQELVPKSEMVINALRILDERANTEVRKGDGRRRRIRTLAKDSIGGYLAHKIFKFRYDDKDHVKVTIWRLQ